MAPPGNHDGNHLDEWAIWYEDQQKLSAECGFARPNIPLLPPEDNHLAWLESVVGVQPPNEPSLTAESKIDLELASMPPQGGSIPSIEEALYAATADAASVIASWKVRLCCLDLDRCLSLLSRAIQ